MNNFYTIVTLTLLNLFSYQSASQNHICYHLGIDEAQQLIDKNKYKEAIELYESILDAVYIKSYRNILQRAKCHFLLNQFEKGTEYLSKAVEYGSTLEDITKNNIDTIVNKTQWNQLLNLYEIERKAHLINFNFQLYIEIERMYHNDTYVRSNRFFGNDSIRLALINEVDSINFEKLQKIISEQGFPTAKEIGVVGMADLRYVILHLGGTWSEEKWNYLNKILLIELKRGNYLPISYSNLVDRKNFDPPAKGGIYGTMLIGDSVIPIDEIENLDSLRRTIGLYSLNRQAELMPRIKVFPKGYLVDELSIEKLCE